jgi:hypothetical protein
MPTLVDVPFELRHYVTPRSMTVGVADRRTGADTLLILTGTVDFPANIDRYAAGDRVERRRIRFGLPQSPKVVTARSQVRSLQVTAGIASFLHRAGGDRCFAIDQAILEWADDLNELRVTIETAFQGAGSTISRVSYSAFVLAQVG